MGTDRLAQPYYEKIKICCDLFFIDMADVTHVPPLVASIMTKFEQILWEHFGNILNEVLRVIKTVDKHAIDFIG